MAATLPRSCSLSRIWTGCKSWPDVYERDLALVKVSQVGRINVEAYPGTDFASVVASIGDVVDPNTGRSKVRAWVDNRDQRLKPEMFARLRLDIGDATRSWRF